jgi:hypothetical protein
MQYRRYATSFVRYRTWPDRLVESLPIPTIVSLALCAALFFGAGASVALPFGFFGSYVGTLAVYLGGVGFALVVGTIHWASRHVHGAYEQLRPIFMVDDDTYFNLTSKWFGRFGKLWLAVFFSLPFLVIMPSGIYFAYETTPNFRRKYQLESLRPMSFTADWYTAEHRRAAIAILFVLGTIIAITLGTATQLLFLNLRFLRAIRRLPVIPVPALVRARLRRVVDLYVGTAFAWTGGVTLFAVAFYGTYDITSIAVIIFLFLVGIATFSVPQLLLRRFITDSHDRLCTMGLAWLHGRLGIEVYERDPADQRIVAALTDNLSDLAQLMDRPKTWIYDSQDVVLVIVGQLVAFLAVFAQGVLAKLVSR